MPSLVWIHAAIAITALLGLVAVVLWWSGTRHSTKRLPQEWPLMQRPVFSWEERALHRQLRAALPNHTLLAKLPLVRFCQPIESEDLRFWFELLGPIHVSFVVCASNGRALAAIDIDKPDRQVSERTLAIKQAVLEACHIRYVKCRADQLPTVAELQLLVPAQGEQARPQVPNPYTATDQHATLAHTVRAPRQMRTDATWKESGFASDSFFAHDRFNERDEEPTAYPPAYSASGASPSEPYSEGAYPPSMPPVAPVQTATARISSIHRRTTSDAGQAPVAPTVDAPIQGSAYPSPSPSRTAPIPFPTPERPPERGSREAIEEEHLRNELRRGIRADLHQDSAPPRFSTSSTASERLDLRLDPLLKPPVISDMAHPRREASPLGPNIHPLRAAAPPVRPVGAPSQTGTNRNFDEGGFNPTSTRPRS